MPLYEYKCPKCRKKVETLSIRAREVYCVCGEEMKLLFPQPAFRVYTK